MKRNWPSYTDDIILLEKICNNFGFGKSPDPCITRFIMEIILIIIGFFSELFTFIFLISLKISAKYRLFGVSEKKGYHTNQIKSFKKNQNFFFKKKRVQSQNSLLIKMKVK